MIPVAVIIGGALCWKEDFDRAEIMLGNSPRQYFIINDHIQTWPGPCIAVTMHAEKLHDRLNGKFAWLTERRLSGLPEPDQIWGFKKHKYVTHSTNQNWQGGSGLLAIYVALREHRRIIGCGLPMTIEGMHFVRKQNWLDAVDLRPGWERSRNDLAPYFRSMSGWTAELFGQPDEEWLSEL